MCVLGLRYMIELSINISLVPLVAMLSLKVMFPPKNTFLHKGRYLQYFQTSEAPKESFPVARLHINCVFEINTLLISVLFCKEPVLDHHLRMDIY